MSQGMPGGKCTFYRDEAQNGSRSHVSIYFAGSNDLWVWQDLQCGNSFIQQDAAPGHGVDSFCWPGGKHDRFSNALSQECAGLIV